MIAAIFAYVFMAVSSAFTPMEIEDEPFIVYEKEEFYVEPEVDVDELCSAWKYNGFYADCGAILEEPGYIVTITMQNGNQFQFYNDDGDWCRGDLVAVLFYDNGTAIVYDDEILTCKYAGWISGKEMKSWIKTTEGN